jgi:hypothetical protein
LFEWLETLQNTEYSYVKEFFAAIDHSTEGWPAPFTQQSVSILFRLFDKYWHSTHKAEFIESLQLRFNALMRYSDTELRPGDLTTIQDIMYQITKHLDMSLQEFITLPENDLWLYSSRQS